MSVLFVASAIACHKEVVDPSVPYSCSRDEECGPGYFCEAVASQSYAGVCRVVGYCTGDNRCLTTGLACREGRCVEIACGYVGDCTGNEVCVPRDVAGLGEDGGQRVCTARQCSEDGSMPCGDGQECVQGICLAVGGPVDEASPEDVPTLEIPAEDTSGVEMVAPPPDRTDCKSCNNSSDCGTDSRWQCMPVGASRHCLLECVDDGDCPPSYLCYAASTVSKVCLPVSYDCVACAFDTPCPGGKVGNFVSGACEDGADLCQKCTYDFDCAAGMRCFKTTGSATGACVPGCSDTVSCSDTANFQCEVTGKGVWLCQPKDTSRCGGCPAATPYPSPDGTSCYECLNSSHCADGKSCDVAGGHVCRTPDAECGLLKKCADGQCHQCCDAADCEGLQGATGTCTDYRCDGVADPCGGACMSPYPVCAVLNGVSQCVQCAQDADCAVLDPACTCTGDPTYTCLFTDGNVCAPSTCPALCASDADCPPGPSGETLLCSGTMDGFCYDPNGKCDGMTSCCPAGSSCFDLLSALYGGMGGMPGMGTGTPGSGMASCTCDEQHPCLGGRPCTATDVFCVLPMIGDMICPGGVKPATMPGSVCIDLMEMVSGITGGI